MSRKPGKQSSPQQGHKGHIWMIATCCGVPIIGLTAIAVLGISLPSLETLLLVLCPIGMIGMMFLIHRDIGCAYHRADADSNLTRVQEQADDDNKTSVSQSERTAVTSGPGVLKA